MLHILILVHVFLPAVQVASTYTGLFQNTSAVKEYLALRGVNPIVK